MKIKQKIFIIIQIAILLMSSSCIRQNNKNQGYLFQIVPKAPKNFEWVYFKGVAVLKPKKWTEFKKHNIYTTSVESVAKKGKFETGLTVQVIRDVKKKSNIFASLYADSLINYLEKNKDNKRLILNDKKGAIRTIIYRFRNSPKGEVPIIVHKFFLINDLEDYINIITFESPVKSWDKYWNNEGNDILKKVMIIPYEEEYIKEFFIEQ